MKTIAAIKDTWYLLQRDQHEMIAKKLDHRKVLFRSDVFVRAALALQFPIDPVESAVLSFQLANPMWFICIARKFCVSNELLKFQSVSPSSN